MESLSRLVAPLTAARFLQEHWEQKPLVHLDCGRRRFDDLLTLDDVDFAVTTTDMRYPQFRMVKDGEPLPLTSYTRPTRGASGEAARAADPARMADAYQAGATLVLQGLHRRWQPLARFCAGLEEELSQPVQTNIYLTPPGARGFTAHYDTHDVFVMQLHGAKKWRLYDAPFKLPLKNQTHRREGVKPGEPLHEFELAAGDVIYIPRGFFHEAETSAASSLHITLGVTSLTWLDLVRSAVEECSRDPAFRGSLPPGWAAPAGGDAGLEEQLRSLLALMCDRAEPASLIAREAAGFHRRRRPLLRGILLDAEEAPDIDSSTQVYRRDGVTPRIDEDETAISLTFHRKMIRLPLVAASSVRYCAASASYRARDLPDDLDEAGRLVLLRRLIREGFCTLRPDEAA